MRRALLFALVAAFAAVAHGLEISVETDFTSDHAAAEASARLKVCSGLTTSPVDTVRKIECVKHLIDPTAACVESGDASTCTVNGVTLTLADVTFSCEGGEYGDPANPVAGCMIEDDGYKTYLTGDGGLPTCPAADSEPSTNGGYNGACSISARCHYINDGAATEFGDYCPASGGTTCCGEGIAILPGAFPANTPTTTFSNLTRLEIDHVVDLDIDITYELQAPADLKISVEVPYVTSTSVVNHNGVNYKLCPSAYLVDFTDPVETIPPLGSWVGTKRGVDGLHANWMPLTHMPMYDLVGDARSICAAQSFSFDPAATGTLAFDYPAIDNASTSVNYNSALGANTTVWTDEFDVPTDFMWRGDIKAGNTRFTWNTTNYFDIVRAYSKCQKRMDGTRLVTPTVEPELSYINGVGYNVTTYSWTMHVCQVGYFGQHCNSHPPGDVSTYAKACKTAPASFSITPQQVSTAVVTPVDSNLYTKTFLQSVRSSTDTCSVNHERYVIVLSLIIYSENYAVVADDVTDLLYPTNVFADPATQADFSVDNSARVTSVAEFMAKLDGADIDGEGVYVLDEVKLTITGGQEIKSQKVVIVTKCYNTGYDSATGVRTTPNAFSEAHKTVANGDSTVFLDLEMLVDRTDADLAGVKQTNTLNLRVLASAETFDLPSKESLAQLDMSATHLIYGDVKAASDDTTLTQSFAKTGNALDSNRRPGDQICSKQQLDDAFAPTANLEPNAVGACILTAAGEGNLNKGKTIKYSVNGVLQPPLTFGCFQNWIDVTDIPQNLDGVYEFPTYPTPLTNTHEGIYWIAKLGDLSEDVIDLGGSNTTTVKDLFGAGLFYYDSTTDTPANQFSDEMQHPSALSLGGIGAGCKNTIGYMKSACNLVCFDLRRNLLSDKEGKDPRKVIVHHISVATIVNEAQSGVVFSRRHHRRLLESVSLSAPASEGSQTSSATSTSILTVVPDRMATPPPPAVDVVNATNVTATSSKDNEEFGPLEIFFIVGGICAVLAIGIAAIVTEKAASKITKGTNSQFMSHGYKMI